MHELKGTRKGFRALTVQANWRIIFRFEEGDVHVVDYLDYQSAYDPWKLDQRRNDLHFQWLAAPACG